jgi:hypothetical protein
MRNASYLNNKKATVLVTVIMLITAMSALAVGILSAMGSQGVFGQNQVDRIKAEQLAKGYFWKVYYETALNGGSPSTVATPVVLDGKTYTVSIAVGGSAGPNGTTPIATTISY